MRLLGVVPKIWRPEGRKFRPGARALDARPGYELFVEGRGPNATRWAKDPVTGKVWPLISGGGIQGWEETLDDNGGAAGTQISNTTTETIIVPDFTIPANYMTVGKVLRYTAWGVVSNVVTTPGTLTFKGYMNAASKSGTQLFVSTAMGMDTVARTNAAWWLQWWIMCVSVGSSGTMMSGGILVMADLIDARNTTPVLATDAPVMVLGSAGTQIASANVAVTVNTTVANLVGCTATFSVNTSPTNLTAQARIIEALN